ncbi:hypothetical protein BACCELL_02749 [Bacteroides cellulosilyticus DSM 14838]|uniref:Uncharacterized protein n=1 Tax=Bacteroides cellulosilyticus DSM 14838 TaxID=537012 RepID=E2NEN3_9BACE|nr:hypothetical protein BACCELL_02749 [Bacteroides cellulosilyticus DSM 14838]
MEAFTNNLIEGNLTKREDFPLFLCLFSIFANPLWTTWKRII